MLWKGLYYCNWLTIVRSCPDHHPFTSREECEAMQPSPNYPEPGTIQLNAFDNTFRYKRKHLVQVSEMKIDVAMCDCQLSSQAG